jgi:hypothetical protein
MHHADTKQQPYMQIFMQHTSFMYKDRLAIPHTPPTRDKRFSKKHPYTLTDTQDMHMHISSNYSPSIFDTETRPRSMRVVLEKKDM